MNILEAIIIAVGVISTILCAIGAIITLLTVGDETNDQA